MQTATNTCDNDNEVLTRLPGKSQELTNCHVDSSRRQAGFEISFKAFLHRVSKNMRQTNLWK